MLQMWKQKESLTVRLKQRLSVANIGEVVLICCMQWPGVTLIIKCYKCGNERKFDGKAERETLCSEHW